MGGVFGCGGCWCGLALGCALSLGFLGGVPSITSEYSQPGVQYGNGCGPFCRCRDKGLTERFRTLATVQANASEVVVTENDNKLDLW